MGRCGCGSLWKVFQVLLFSQWNRDPGHQLRARMMKELLDVRGKVWKSCLSKSRRVNGRDDMFLGITSEVSESSKHAGMISPVTFSCMSIGLHGGGGAGFNQTWVFAQWVCWRKSLGNWRCVFRVIIMTGQQFELRKEEMKMQTCWKKNVNELKD